MLTTCSLLKCCMHRTQQRSAELVSAEEKKRETPIQTQLRGAKLKAHVRSRAEQTNMY